ncbi:MAG: hypothetical protein ABJB02_10005 [Dokdonella sp.]
MRKIIITTLISSAFALPAVVFAAGGSGHGAAVSQAAASARAGGVNVGTSVRAVARGNSQGPVHASQNAILHVNGAHGRAGANSVLGTGVSTNPGVRLRGHSGH